MSSKSVIVFSLIFLWLSFVCLVSATPNTKWISIFDGGNDDEAYCVVETYDGGFALAGITNSFDHSNYDFWLVKTNAIGEEQWNMTYGGSGNAIVMSMVVTDSGYALAGSIKDQSNDTWLDDNDDVWLVKTDSQGIMLWNKTYGGSDYERAKSIIASSDGGYVLACETRSFGGGGADFWLIKTDSDGVMEWNMTYGGEENEFASSVVETLDGGYAVTGSTIPIGEGKADFWLIKTDSIGKLQWNQTYGGVGTEYSNSMIVNEDGGYSLTGSTTSFGSGDWDVWLVKTDSDGVMEWNMTYGGEENEYGGSLVVDNNENYWIACIQQPTVGDGHLWLLETNLAGSIKSNQTYTVSAHHSSTSIIKTNNDDLAIAYSSRDSGEYRDITLIVLENVKADSIIPIILGFLVTILLILFLALYFNRKKYRI